MKKRMWAFFLWLTVVTGLLSGTAWAQDTGAANIDTITYPNDTRSTITVDRVTGNVTEKVVTGDGVIGTTVIDKRGELLSLSASVSAAAAKAAQSGQPLTLPIQVPVASSIADALTIAVTIPADTGAVTAEFPVEDVTTGVVAVVVGADGTQKIVRTAVPTENGVALTLSGETAVKIIDNSRVFTDVARDDWFADAIRFVTAREIFNGTGSDTFSPETHMTRGMLAQVLYNLDDARETALPADFSDVPDDAWCASAVAWAAENKIVSGYGDGTFGVNDNITQEQLAVILWRYAGSPAAKQTTLNFTDADQASEYALEALKWASENGIISGTGNSVLSPKGLVTRAQVAQSLWNLLK